MTIRTITQGALRKICPTTTGAKIKSKLHSTHNHNFFTIITPKTLHQHNTFFTSIATDVKDDSRAVAVI
jgi:hypothetical protein